MKNKLKKTPGESILLSAGNIIILVVFILSLTLLIAVIIHVFGRGQKLFDQKIFELLSNTVSARNTTALRSFTFLGSHLFLIPAWLLLFAWYLFIRNNKWCFSRIATIATGNLLLMFGLKYCFSRPRPLVPLIAEVTGLSFPSGHAFMGLVFFGLIIMIIYHDISNKWLKCSLIFVLSFVIFLVGLSRIYLRLHYATDVIAGFCFGILSLIISYYMILSPGKKAF